MSLLAFFRARALLWQAHRHAAAMRLLSAALDDRRRRLGLCLDALEAGIAAGRIVVKNRP